MRRRFGLVCLALALGPGVTGCAVQTAALLAQVPAGLPAQHELTATPFYPQTEQLCGPATLATALGAIGLQATPAALADEVYLPARGGSLQAELLAAVHRHGALATELPGRLDAVLTELAAGRVVVVLQNLGLSWAPAWHYAVVIGYDLSAREVILRSGTQRRLRLPLRTFEFTWGRSDFWAFVASRPGDWPATAVESAVLRAALGFERSAPPAAARQAYASALQRWPGNLSLAMGLGNATFAAGDAAAAADVFAATAQRHRSAAAWINLASTWLSLQRPQQALDAARSAVALADPTWARQAAEVLAEAERAAAPP